MVSRPDDGVGAVGPMTVPFLLEAHFRGGTLVVRPVGELTPKTYERLRDYLLQCAAEEPAGSAPGAEAGIALTVMEITPVLVKVTEP